MAVKSIARAGSCSKSENSPYDFDEADDLDTIQTVLNDSEPAIWPRGDEDGDDLPPAQGGCRRVSHDW